MLENSLRTTARRSRLPGTYSRQILHLNLDLKKLADCREMDIALVKTTIEFIEPAVFYEILPVGVCVSRSGRRALPQNLLFSTKPPVTCQLKVRLSMSIITKIHIQQTCYRTSFRQLSPGSCTKNMRRTGRYDYIGIPAPSAHIGTSFSVFTPWQFKPFVAPALINNN